MNRRTFWIVLIVIILFVLIGSYFLILNLPSPQKAVKDYFNYIKNGEYENAYNLLTGNYKNAKGTLEEFIAQFENARAHGTVYESVKINSITNTLKKSQKIVAFTLKVKESGRETTSSGQYLVIKEADNIWKIADSMQ